MYFRLKINKKSGYILGEKLLQQKNYSSKSSPTNNWIFFQPPSTGSYKSSTDLSHRIMRHHGGFQLTREPLQRCARLISFFWHQNRNSDYSKIMNDIFGMSILFSDFCRLLWKKSKWPIENSHSKKSLWPIWLPVATAQQHGRKQGHSGRPLSTFLLNNNVHHPRSFFQLNSLKKGTLFSEERILLKASFCRRIC